MQRKIKEVRYGILEARLDTTLMEEVGVVLHNLTVAFYNPSLIIKWT